MKKSLKRFAVIFMAVVTLAAGSTTLAMAAEVTDPGDIVISADSTIGGGTAEPQGDVIVIKYRTYNGVLQYRRWNETQQCWVDPDWINV